MTNLGITRVCGPRCLGRASREKTTAGSSSLPAGLKVPYRKRPGRQGARCFAPRTPAQGQQQARSWDSLQRAGCQTLLPWQWHQGEVHYTYSSGDRSNIFGEFIA